MPAAICALMSISCCNFSLCPLPAVNILHILPIRLHLNCTKCSRLSWDWSIFLPSQCFRPDLPWFSLEKLQALQQWQIMQLQSMKGKNSTHRVSNFYTAITTFQLLLPFVYFLHTISNTAQTIKQNVPEHPQLQGPQNLQGLQRSWKNFFC